MYTCSLCSYSTDQHKLYNRHIGRRRHKEMVLRTDYPPINIDFLFKLYVDYNYNDSVKLVEIHNECGGTIRCNWCPLEIVIDDERYKCKGSYGMWLLDALLYVLYGDPMDYTKSCELKCRYGSLVYVIKRDSKTKSIMEYVDGEEYPISKGVDEQVEYMVGGLDDFKKKYIYYWKAVAPSIEVDVDGYIESVESRLVYAKEVKYKEVLELTKKMEGVDSEIKSIELDIASLHVSKEDMFEVDRQYHDYNRMVDKYNIELVKYRNTNHSISSIDSNVSEDGRYLLDLKKKIYGVRYIPDEYNMMKSRYNLLDNLRMSIQSKVGEKLVLVNKIDYERDIVQGRLVPEEWLNMEIYKECLKLDVDTIVDTYIEYIGINYKRELEYTNGKWCGDGLSSEYCNWLISRCMSGEGFQIVITNDKLDDIDGLVVINADKIDSV